ncbi:MAG: type 4a pilus biogenesis protein PilO [Deltaproteobacteria bacterium]|nr:type 4a pilus biogenesis protein PilO [Deltaproteobacteria bacterium]
MNSQLENILQLPIQHKILIMLASLLLIGGAFWYLFYSPVYESYAETKKKVDGENGLRYQIAQQKAIAANLDKFLVEVDRLEVELKKALTELPDKKEIDELLAKVSSVGKDSGLDIQLFKPRHEEKKDYYAEVPVELIVSGSYHQVATFFDEVGHLSRIVNLDEFHMREPELIDNAMALQANVVATTFRFLDENERPQVEEQKADKRRARGRKK